jgi:circadian clock protein KaiB
VKESNKETEPASAATLAQAATDHDQSRYVLRLYVSGMTQRSSRAIANAKAICETHLHGRYDLEVIDVYQQPKLIQQDQIIAAPTLIRKLPLPLRRIVGDLADTEKTLVALDLKRRE